MRSTEKPCNQICFTADHQSTDYHQQTSRTAPWRVWPATAIITLALTSTALAADSETPDWQQDLFEIGLVLAALFIWSAIFPAKKKKDGEDGDGPDFDIDFPRRRSNESGDGDGDGGGGCGGGGCGGD